MFLIQRAGILAKLAECQLPESELKMLYTTAKLGTGNKLYQNKQYALILVHATWMIGNKTARIYTIPEYSKILIAAFCLLFPG